MNNKFESYADKVIMLIGVNGKKAREIREDILGILIEKEQVTSESDPYKLMGDPKDVADEFIENLGLKDYRRISYRWPAYDYKSKRKIFGIPLVHIVSSRLGVAKGIIAIGPIAVGFISFGGISIGMLGFGGISLGLLIALGGMSVSGVVSFGGMAISAFASFGGLAVAKCFAVGGYAAADIAIGGVTKGIVGIFTQSGTGTYLFKSPANSREVVDAVTHVYPRLGGIVSKIIEIFI